MPLKGVEVRVLSAAPMKTKDKIKEAWKAIGILHPRHRMAAGWHEDYRGTDAYCTDDSPDGWGNFGCKRCDAIVALEKGRRKLKIWPRSKVA